MPPPHRDGSGAPVTTPEPHPRTHLFVVYLGGDVAAGRMGEDHEVVLVAATDPRAARRRAKAKWAGTGRPHVDALARVDRVDGHVVHLEPAPVEGDDIVVDP